jgi:hypothetical protein
MNSCVARSLVVIGLATLGSASAAAQRAEPPDTLTAEERALAFRLAEEAVRPLRTRAPMYLVASELIRPKGNEARQALVTHYRYEGDLAVLTTVDFGRRSVVALDTVPHLVVPIVPAEVERARDLALADPRVSRVVEPYRNELQVEAIQSRAASAADPLFGHRVVRLLFRVRRGWLDDPLVHVDLTAGRVLVEEGRPE